MAAIQTVWEEATIIQKEEPELRVVAFYENLETGEWAKEIFDRIRQRIPRDTGATPGLWRFDILEDDHLHDLAAADAANAAVIIVASRGTRPLPPCLLDCVEKALSQKRRARVGLVAVLEDADKKPKEALPAYRQLQAVSRKARLQFFSLPRRNLVDPPALNETLQFTSNRLLDYSLTIETHSYRAWGINE